MRPTSTMSSQSTPLPHVRVANLERRLDAVMLRGRRDEGAQGFGGPSLAPDYLTDITGGDTQFHHRHAAVRRLRDLHRGGLIHERARGDLHGRRDRAGHGYSPGACAGAASASFA